MPYIKWEYADALCNGVYELCVLTYLQGLVHFCATLQVFDDDSITIAQKDAADYLWDQQRAVVQKLKQLTQQDDFITNGETPEPTDCENASDR